MNEKRVSNLEIKTRDLEDTKEKIIEGYFIVFDVETELYPGYFEKISRSAINTLFDKDVKALINHDDTLVLGRTKTNTLQLMVDDKGVYGKILINENDTDALNIYERVKRGDVSQCSFGFIIQDQESFWDDDNLKVTLTDIDLKEVSIVTFPAYEETEVYARSKLENKRKELLNIKKNKIKEKFKNVIKNINVK